MNNENWYYDNTTGCVCTHDKVIAKIINHDTQGGQDNAQIITHAHELFDIVREMAQCKPHEFSTLPCPVQIPHLLQPTLASYLFIQTIIASLPQNGHGFSFSVMLYLP